MKRQCVLVVDDMPEILLVARTILDRQYEVIEADSGEHAISIARAVKPDLILLDIVMPGMDGYETCKRLKEDYRTRAIPVIFVTALGEVKDEAYGFEVGAVDYITKPANPALLRARVKTHLALYDQKRELQRMVDQATEEIRETQKIVIERLGRAGEIRDNETGKHVIRMSLYSRVLALALGMSEEDANTLQLAAPMHDIGKITIPDAILRNKEALSEHDMERMRAHTLHGAEIIGEHHGDLLKIARTVAMSHHEKWDGTGYPDGLKGEEIPLVSRIVAIADVFDALTSKRPYKEPWPVEQALLYIESRAGTHFDPEITPLLRKNLASIMEIYDRYADDITGNTAMYQEPVDETAIYLRR